MMPLSMAKIGEAALVKKVGGREETQKFLEALGLTVGSTIQIVAKTGENVIVNIRESRVAISSELARRIYI
jgi:ferrous iron transport protein A